MNNDPDKVELVTVDDAIRQIEKFVLPNLRQYVVQEILKGHISAQKSMGYWYTELIVYLEELREEESGR